MCSFRSNSNINTEFGRKLLRLVVLIAFSDAFAFQPVWSVILVLYVESEIPCSEPLGMLVEAHLLLIIDEVKKGSIILPSC
jgi:hypothetical protein